MKRTYNKSVINRTERLYSCTQSTLTAILKIWAHIFFISY